MWFNYMFFLSLRGNLGELNNTIQFEVDDLNTYESEEVDIFSFEWKTNYLANLRLIFIYVKALFTSSFVSLSHGCEVWVDQGERSEQVDEICQDMR